MFLEEIKPYIKDLEVYQVQQSLPNEVKRKAIFAIFDKYIKFKEYPQSAKTSIGCGACVKNVMNRLFGMLTRERVLDAMNYITQSVPVQRDLEDQIKEEEYSSIGAINIDEDKCLADVDLWILKTIGEVKAMRWGELKKYATSQGINTVGKKKVEILKELGV